MSDHVRQTIRHLQQEIERLEGEVAEHKETVNSLCKLQGMAPVYSDIGPSSKKSAGIRADEFYGKPLAQAARKVLELRQEAAPLEDIYNAMIQGGFQFDTDDESNAKRILSISLSKNTATFHRLPNDTIGLLQWYPTVKNGRKRKGKNTTAEKPLSDDEEKPVHDETPEANAEAQEDVAEEQVTEAPPKKG